MLKAQWCKYRLDFRFLAKTSRESMLYKDTYFIRLYDESSPEVYGVGECGLFKGLSADDVDGYEDIISSVCRNPEGELPPMSSIIMGFETAARDLANGGRHVVYASDWLDGQRGIEINGLIWMGDKHTMKHRIDEKLAAGFKVLKLKIGGINFSDEIDLLRYIRGIYPVDALELRLDANGSFTPDNAMRRIEMLSPLGIHSIEQPIRAGQISEMARICAESPIPVALDEELIGTRNREESRQLLMETRPRYIILKPALCGGFLGADTWIEEADRLGIGHWFTSALESNVGLEAIARHIAEKSCDMPQGLGTGQLFHNNFDSPLYLNGDRMCFDASKKLRIPDLPWHQ